MIVTGGEALVDLVEEQGRWRAVAGGGPFNTAIAFGRLGVPAAFLGAISRDGYGELLAERLGDAGVDMSLVRWSDAPTPRAIVHRRADGKSEYEFHLDGTSLGDFRPHDLPALPAEAWALHVGTLALAIDPPAAAYEALAARDAGQRLIIFDPNVRPAIFGDPGVYRSRFERLVRLADVVKLSDDDAAWIYPGLPVQDVVELILALGPRIVALTRGEEGAVAASPAALVDVPGIPIAVVDTVGAGDSFGAALVAALVDEAALGPGGTRTPDEAVLARAVSYAVAASAVTCTRAGAVPPSRAEVERQLGALGAPQA